MSDLRASLEGGVAETTGVATVRLSGRSTRGHARGDDAAKHPFPLPFDPRSMRIVALVAGLSMLAAGCVEVLPYESTGGGAEPTFPPAPPTPTPAQDPRDVGRLQLLWPASSARPEAADTMRDDLAAWVAPVDAHLILPRDLEIVHTQCGIQNAYYSPDDKRVTLCWELLDLISGVMQDPQLSPDEVQLGIGSVWLFVMFHEMGHGLVDILGLPITGREEDAVDDLATLLLIDAGASDAAVNAAVFWILTDDGSYSDAKFADEHSVNVQRFYTILCTVYGSDPTGWALIVEQGYLPYERAQRCPREYAQKDAAWSKLLEPWTAAQSRAREHSAFVPDA